MNSRVGLAMLFSAFGTPHLNKKKQNMKIPFHLRESKLGGRLQRKRSSKAQTPVEWPKLLAAVLVGKEA